MKRSRYSAAMSIWPGASNHSWERKRPLAVAGRRGAGFVSDMSNLVLGLAGNLDVEAEQPAGLRLLSDLVRRQVLGGRGGVDGLQITAGKTDLGDVGDRQPDLAQQPAVRRVAIDAPAEIERVPHIARAVDHRAVHIALAVPRADLRLA